MMSRKHSKNKRERDKSHSKKSNSERHGSNPAEKKGKTEKKLHYSGGSSPQKQTSLSSYTGKRRKRSYSEIETSTTNTEDQMKSSWTRSPDSKDKCKLVCKFDAIQSATSLGKTSSSNHENIKSKSKQKKKHRKHSREESRRENRHRSTSKKCAAARNDSGDQSHKVQRCKKCQSSIVCKHLLKCKSKPSVDNVEIGVLKTKRSSPTFESLQTHFQDYVRKSNLLQKAEEVFEKDAGKHSILEPTVVTSKFTSSCDEFRHLSKEPKNKEQTKNDPELQGESNYSDIMQKSANVQDSGKASTNYEELLDSKNKSPSMNLYEKPKIANKEFDVWKVTEAPLKAVKNTENFNDGSKFLESDFWKKCNKISNCLRGLRKKSKRLEQISNETSIARASSHLVRFSGKPDGDFKPLEVKKPSISVEEPTTSGTTFREIERPFSDSRSTELVNEGKEVLGYSQKPQPSNSNQQSKNIKSDESSFSSINSENTEQLETIKHAKKFHSFKIPKKVYAADAISQAASKKLLISGGTRLTGKSSYHTTISTSLPQDHVFSPQQPDSHIISTDSVFPDDADMDTDQKMEIAEELQAARYEKVLEVELGQSYGELTSMEIDPPQEVKTSILSQVISQPDILLVLDTNIFINHLNIIINLKDHGVSDSPRLKTVIGTEGSVVSQNGCVGFPIMVIPWIVLQELDSLKNGKIPGSVNYKAILAVQFVYSCIKSRHPRVWGQSMQQAAQKFCGLREENNDDRVLQCCMQYQQLYPHAHVLLCSDDKNLCSKALVSSVKAVRKNDLLNELKNLKSVRDDTNIQDLNMFSQPQSGKILRDNVSKVKARSRNKVKQKDLNIQNQDGKGLFAQKFVLDITSITSQLEKSLGCALSVILETEMKIVYDHLWTEILFLKPPWSLKDILACMKKHWIAVFGLIVERNLQSSVNILSDSLQTDKRPSYNRLTLSCMLTESKTLLQGFSSRSDYGGVLPRTLAALDELLSKVSEGDKKIEPNSECLQESKESSEKVDISFESPLNSDPGKNVTLLPFNCHTGFPVSGMENAQVVNKSQQIWATFENVWNIINKYSSLIFATFSLPYNSLAVAIDSKLPLPEEAFQSLQKLVPAVKELLSGIQRILSSDCNVRDFEKLMEILRIFLTNGEQTNNSSMGISAQDLHECFTHEEYRITVTSSAAESWYRI
ncbi:transcriptional protein SWT1 isoform X6 [Narcine bancroftii]|uniref:transcriptional protein SWT1 isoform X6 n=1 Tax=Narcine bancroftii TaxID=1343680 RepID=UPI003831CB16